MPTHEHSDRLCATCSVERFEQIRPAARARTAAELVAARIRRDRGRVWGAVVAFRISYDHALRIRRGWRGAGRIVETIPYSSRGYTGSAAGGSQRNGWSSLLPELRELEFHDGPVFDAILDGIAGVAG